MVRILADFHHQALYHSLHMLFEGRLGWELYRPIGKEWFEQGFWNVYNHPHTAEQFLGLHQGTNMPMDVHGDPLPEIERKNLHYKVEDGVYYIKDLTYNTTHRAIRLDKVKEMDFDIVLASMPQHVEPYKRLIQEHSPHAKFVFQMGNNWQIPSGVQNAMISARIDGYKPNHNQHIVSYHQEFDLDVFKFTPPKFHNVVNSYVHYMQKPQLLQKVIADLPGWTGTTYGAGMHLQLQGVQAVANAMENSAFTWHYKPGGDGFGHVIYSTYAMGRPAIVHGAHYRGSMARELLQDGITCIDTSIRTGQEVVKALKYHSRSEEHTKMCEQAYKRFKECVDFDLEASHVKLFMEQLR